MIRLKDVYVGLGVAALALLPAVSALGQDTQSRPQPAGGGQSSGVAVPRGGGSSAPAPSGGSTPSPTSGGASTGAGSWGGGRTNDDGGGSRRAVGGGSYSGPPTNEQAGARRSGGGDAVTAAPWYARPRGNEPAIGVAIARDPSRPPVSAGSGGSYNPYQGYYPGYPGYYPGYPGYGYGYGYNPWYGWGAFGLGYFYYDPFYWGYGAQYGGAGYYGYGDSPYGYGSGPGGFGRTGYGSQHVEGGLRLKVKPNTANIFVDGYFAGRVDDFDGMFQKLAIAEGHHKIEITAQGYKALVFEVNIQAFETITYTGTLEPLVR